MSLTALIVLIALFFVTSIVGVVTGSNSLITVPVMFQFGIDEKVAVATNMFGLTFMSVGGTIPFVRQGRINYGKVWPLVLLTLVGSAAGAALVGQITNQSLKLIVSVAMIVVAGFTFWRREHGGGEGSTVEANKPLVYALSFALAIYGGLYSGGYVTMLTAVLVAFFAMPFGEAVGATKLINVFSSLIATAIFIWQGLVDYKLGLILAVTMFIGAYIGAHYASKMNETLLRRIFLTTVVLLALKTLYDLSGALLLW
jgi:uncharacterized protein